MTRTRFIMSSQHSIVILLSLVVIQVLQLSSNWISLNNGVDAFQLQPKIRIRSRRSNNNNKISASAFTKKNMNTISLLSIRGGAVASSTTDGTDDTDDTDIVSTESEDENEGEDDETMSKSSPSPSTSTTSSATPIKLIISTTSSTKSKSSSSSSSHNPIIHPHNLEMTISSTRTLSSLKQSISKQLFRNVKNLPIDLLVLKINGDIVNEREDDDDDDDGKKEMTIGDLLDEYYDEDDIDGDDLEHDDEEEEDDDDDIPKLKIQVDIIPPVNSKFGTDIQEYISNMSNEELFHAYVMNNACMYYNLKDLNDIENWIINCNDEDDIIGGDEIDDDDEEEEEEEDGEKEDKGKNAMWNIRQGSSSSSSSTLGDVQMNALLLKEQIMSLLSTQELELLKQVKKDDDDDDIDSLTSGDVLLKESLKRKMKRRGGATMNVKRTLQKNLNIVSTVVLSQHTFNIYVIEKKKRVFPFQISHFLILTFSFLSLSLLSTIQNWADTIRNFLLFLFFGYFGGRNATSRTIMLLGAPACFISQARPVKIMFKQLFYAVGEPHGLLLSLLPAPQQAIMSCDYNSLMVGLYGKDVGEYNELVVGTGGARSGEGEFIDEEEDVEEEEEEEESDYDSDEDEYDFDDE
jgi:hypothetical protein